MKLSDQQILAIFGQVLMHREPGFLHSYADAVCCATTADFLILRPASLILIGKYNLGHLLANSDPELKVHNYGRAGRTM